MTLIKAATASISSAAAWVLAIRPRTLPLAASPVLVGAALAWHDRLTLRPGPLLAALAGAIAIQAGTNLLNDASDAERGVDGPLRRGPPRATALGLLSATQVRAGALACFAIAALLGVYLAAVGGWPILLLGVLSILSGLAYSTGPMPISFTPLGELFVVAFFGIGAVAGTHYLQVGEASAAAIFAGLVIGMPAAAVLHLNNTRDAAGDARAGRRTLAILAGPRAARMIYRLLIISPYPLLGALAALPAWPLSPVLPLLTLPAALWLARSIGQGEDSADLNALLARTVGLAIALAMAMSAALIM